MIGHYSTGDLADYRAGTVSDGKAARISAHLGSCPQCASVDSGLADVSQVLAGVAVPAMPDTLTHRLHAAIADEAARRTASPAAVPGRPDLPERAKHPHHQRRIKNWSPQLARGLAAAAAAIVLLVGGGILLANLRGGGLAGAGSAPTSRPATSRGRGSAVGLRQAVPLHYRSGTELVSTNAVTSNMDYTKADLPAGVRRAMADSPRFATPSGHAVGSSPDVEARHPLDHTTVGQLESCLTTVAVGRVVQVVELARYLGQPATIIAFKPTGNVFEVIVVGPACGATNQDIITSLNVPTK